MGAATAAQVSTVLGSRLRAGCAYLVETRHPDEAPRILAAQLARGAVGLCVTRRHLDAMRAVPGLEHVPFVWLNDDFRQPVVGPARLKHLEEMLAQALDRGAVVWFEGLDHLTDCAGFVDVYTVARHLIEKAMASPGVLLLAMDPGTFREEQREQIEADVESVLII